MPRRSLTASPPETFVLTLWTDDPAVACAADAAGVDRVGVDLERIGKAQRQAGLGTWISPHSEHDLERVGAVLDHADLFARVNPMHGGTVAEVDRVLAIGARVLMLPMVESEEDAHAFCRLVGGRATVVLLAETNAAIANLAALTSVDGVAEVHIGLNDLALSRGLTNRWLTLADDTAVRAGAAVCGAGRRFGLGGIGRAGQVGLPVPADLVYAEYARTGATAALLSRSFTASGGARLEREIARARARLAEWSAAPAEELEAAHLELGRCARAADCW